MREIRTDNWAKGANNLAKPERLPDGFVRQLSNLDPSADGELSLRAGFTGLVAASDMRLALAMRDKVVYVDGLSIGCYQVEIDTAGTIGALTSGGPIAGAILNGSAYLCTATDSLRTDGQTVKRWAVAEPGFDVDVIDGALAGGIYKVAVVALGDDGEESGAEPLILRVGEGQALRVRSTDPRSLIVYVSVADGSTLYSQGMLIGGALAITKVDDDSRRLTTAGLVPMPACTMLAAYHSVIVGAYDRWVLFSDPMHPHLANPVAGFFQYGEEVAVIAPTDGGVYVAADKTYFITGVETDAPTQRVVLEMGAVPGTAVMLPDGSAAWFTRYGLAIGSVDGVVSLPNKTTYAPDIASTGAAGVVEHNGNAMVVSTMRGLSKPNNLATGDFADLET